MAFEVQIYGRRSTAVPVKRTVRSPNTYSLTCHREMSWKFLRSWWRMASRQDSHNVSRAFTADLRIWTSRYLALL